MNNLKQCPCLPKTLKKNEKVRLSIKVLEVAFGFCVPRQGYGVRRCGTVQPRRSRGGRGKCCNLLEGQMKGEAVASDSNHRR